MNFRLALAAIVLLLAQDAKDTSGADVDGPYVFEDGSTWVAKRIVREPSGLVAKREPLEGGTTRVHLPGRKPLEVKLRPAGEPPKSSGPAPGRLLALSDIEGNIDALIGLLRAGGAINKDLEWTFGKDHVIFVGDMFDRGLHVTECLWLLYELEARAAAAGGAVHFVLGNHEVMNLTGDLRYVRKKYRENAALLGEKLEDLYSRRTVLGRWLRSRNAIQQIGDHLFVHGGVSRSVANAKPTLQEMNDALRKALMADAWRKPKERPLTLVTDGETGLLWYRGYLKDPIDEKEMDAILAAFDVRRIVVGHTLVPDVAFVLDGRVLALDVKHAAGVNQAALWESGGWSRLSLDGTKVLLK